MKIETGKYLYGLRYYILFSFLLFFASSAGGYYLAQNFPREIEEYIREMESFLAPAREMSSFELFIFIFNNNVTKLFYALIFSFIGGFSSLLTIVVNGLILGIFAEIVIKKVSLTYFVAGILPHGILELSVFFVLTAIGFRIGKTATWKLFGKGGNLTLELAQGIRFYILVLAPPLFVAALMEAFITPLILSFFV